MLRSYLIALVLIALNATSISRADEPLRVGVIAPLSGDAASWGTSFRAAMELAHESLDEFSRRSLVLAFEDDQMQPKNTITAFHKLLAAQDMDVVVNLSSGTANALAPLTEQRRVPLIAVASDPKIVEGRRYAFNFWVTPEAEARALLNECQRRGYKRIARISAVHNGAEAANRAFDDANQGRIKLIYDEEILLEARDFRAAISKLRSLEGLDAIIPVLFPGQLSAFAVQARRAGITAPFFGWEFFEDSNEIRAAKGALDGAWYVNGADGSDAFTKSFRDRHPELSLFAAANGHDLVYLLVAAVKEGTPTGERVRQFLAELRDFKGVLGTYSATGDGRFSLPAAIKEVRGETFITVREVTLP